MKHSYWGFSVIYIKQCIITYIWYTYSEKTSELLLEYVYQYVGNNALFYINGWKPSKKVFYKIVIDHFFK